MTANPFLSTAPLVSDLNSVETAELFLDAHAPCEQITGLPPRCRCGSLLPCHTATVVATLLADLERARGLAAAYEAQLAEVAALAETWRYKGQFGWGAWQTGEGPDQEGYILDDAAGQIRAIVTCQGDYDGMDGAE